jgi:hypothetical protein
MEIIYEIQSGNGVLPIILENIPIMPIVATLDVAGNDVPPPKPK